MVFGNVAFFAKMSPAQEKNPYDNIKKMEMYYHENYPHMKDLANMLAKFFNSENNPITVYCNH